MKIVVTTPLYPPDIEEEAAYSKEAAKRLAEKHHVTVVAYTRLPEKIPGVEVISVSKRQPIFLRVPKYTYALLRAARGADLIYVQNGVSVELPVVLVSFVTRAQIVLHIADPAAHARAKKSLLLNLIQQLAFSRSKNIFVDMPVRKPEILPFEPHPTEALSTYEDSWREHLQRLGHILRHG